MKRLASLPLALLVVLLPAAVAMADGDEDRARQLFEAAHEAGEAGRLAVARDLFEESYELVPRMQTAYNLGVVLWELGDVLAAEALLTRVAGEDLNVDDRRELDALLSQVSGDVAVVTVDLRGDRAGAELRLDGALTTGTGDRREVRVDPGHHIATARAPDGRADEAEFEADRGSREAVTLDLGVALTSASGATSPTDGADDSRSSVWIWVTVGVVAVGIAAAIAAIAVASSGDDLTEDPVWGRGEVLSSGLRW